jgi:spermidine synthase
MPMSARLRFLWVVFAGGAVLMALEILSSRILAPRFGSSVYVWGSIISVFLAALAAGYAWGGRLADRDPTFTGLGRMVTWAAAAQALLLVFGTRLADLLGAWTGAAPWGTLLAATLLFAPPAVLLATLSPYAVRLAAHDLEHLGHTAGRLYALSTLGSLVGTLGATFGLIPHLALEASLALILGVTAATAVLALAGEPRRERLSLAAAALLLVAALVGPPSLGGDEPGLVHQRMTPHQTLRVIDEDGIRYLESDRVRHGAVRLADGEMALSYPRLFPLAWAYRPEARRVLILGMGGGNSASYLRGAFAGVAVDLVEIDPAVPQVARRFMGFAAGDGIRVHVDDGRRFLEQREERWDVIIADTYIGLSVPFHMTTREFLATVDAHLAPGGVFVVNLAAGLREPFPRAIYRTLAERFETVDAFPVPGLSNTVLFARHGERPSTAALRRAAAELDRRGDFRPPLAELVRHRLPAAVDVSGVPVLSDRFAPVDRLIHLDAADLPAGAAP